MSDLQRPNILFIMADQFRGDCLGIVGHPDVKTPYLDTLASNGVLFNRAYSSCPSCIAARAALHTGLSQASHRRVGYKDGIPWRYSHTLAGELAKSGYYTQCVGKMHVHPLRNYLGFHNVELHDGYLHCARAASVPYRESQLVADDYFYWLRKELGGDADITDNGTECNSYIARPFAHEEKYHPTNWVTDRSIDFLRRRDPDQPFFLMASYVRPHPPFDAPACYFDLYKDKELTPPAVGDWEDEKLWQEKGRIFNSVTGPLDEELIRQAQVGYYACITHLDHQIGRLLQAMGEQEVMDNTLIIFTADHGEELCDHHLFRKSRPYEGSSHIPLIISGNPALTGLIPHSVCHKVAELRDIMPTLLDFAGAEIPAEIEGESLLPLMRQEKVEFRDYIHGEHARGTFSNHFIVTETDKYCWYSVSGKEQYFNLAEDPHELHDKIADEDCQSRIACLRQLLVKELTNRPEGFVKDGVLITGRPYSAYIE